MIDYTINDGIAVIRWNHRGPVNIKDWETIPAFIAALDRAIADPAVTGIVIGSARPEFIVGADLGLFREPAETGLSLLLPPLRKALRTLELGPKPVVAAINGTALGGGLEIALACHARIAADEPATRLGFPEVTLGLIPGCGGTQRLPRLIGMDVALPMLMDARQIGVADAHAAGLVDAIAPRDALLQHAIEHCRTLQTPQQPWDRKGFVLPGSSPHSPTWRQHFGARSAQLIGRDWSRRAAPQALLETLYQGLQRTIDRGLAIEADAFDRLARGAEARDRIRIEVFARRRADSLAARPEAQKPAQIVHVAIIGSGLMGAGIARVTAQSGRRVTLIDISAQAAAAGKAGIAHALANKAGADALLDRITPAQEYDLLADADLVIEAVNEDVAVKHAVLRRAAAAAGPATLLASNTSTIAIHLLAESLTDPAQFIGLHFFSPVHHMRLVEVIPGRDTGSCALAHGMDFVRSLGKTPVLAGDGPGFFTSRIFTRYLREAIGMVGEGISPVLIEHAARRIGMPVGPLAVVDETGIDLLAHICAMLREQPDGLRDAEDDGADAVIDDMLTLGRASRRAGGGFYHQPDPDCPRRIWSGLAQRWPVAPQQPTIDAIADRLLAIQAAEARRARADGVIADDDDADLASVLGWGFPAHRGGVLGWAARLGPMQFDALLAELSARHGARFQAPSPDKRS